MGIGRENGFSVVEGFGSPAADVGHFPSATPRSDDFRRRSERAGKRRKKRKKTKQNNLCPPQNEKRGRRKQNISSQNQ